MAVDLKNELSDAKGFSERNILRMLTFYKENQSITIWQLPVAKLENEDNLIPPLAVSELKTEETPISPKALAKLQTI